MTRQRREPNRLIGRFFALFALLMIAASLLTRTFEPEDEQQPLPEDAQQVLYALSGEVSLACGNEPEVAVEPASAHHLAPRCTIETNAGASAVVTLDWGQVLVLLGPNAELTIDRIQRRQVTKTLKLEGHLIHGKATCWIQSGLLDGATVQLQAGPAELRASAGLLEVVAYDQEGARLAVHEGRVRVASATHEVTVSSGQELAIARDDPPRPISSLLEPPDKPALPETLVVRPNPAPSPLAETVAPTPSVPYAFYTVKPNDTLDQIAQAHGLTWAELWEYNQDSLTDPTILLPGQRLRIPLRQTD